MRPSILVELGIRCTLSQLVETGVMHADPHGGNLLKLPNGALAYLDFGRDNGADLIPFLVRPRVWKKP